MIELVEINCQNPCYRRTKRDIPRISMQKKRNISRAALKERCLLREFVVCLTDCSMAASDFQPNLADELLTCIVFQSGQISAGMGELFDARIAFKLYNMTTR